MRCGEGETYRFLSAAGRAAQSPCKGRIREWGRTGQLQLIHKSRALGKSPALSGPALSSQKEGGGLDDPSGSVTLSMHLISGLQAQLDSGKSEYRVLPLSLLHGAHKLPDPKSPRRLSSEINGLMGSPDGWWLRRAMGGETGQGSP